MTTNNTKHGYYLANGSYLEYDLSPDSSIIEVVHKLACDYLEVSGQEPQQVWMTPKYVSILNKQVTSRQVDFAGYLDGFTYPQFIRIQTPVGPVVVMIKPRLNVPIFVGSEKELEDNNFVELMDKILTQPS